jgi:cysteine desulfurase
MRRIYLDHAATSPMRPEVREAMLPWLDSGNASSQHEEGRRARQAIDVARERISTAMGFEFAETLFTSGGTEAANLAIVGFAMGYEGPHRRIAMGASEHHCVLETTAILQRLGFTVDLLPVDRDGRVVPRDVGEVALISVMHANNETGAINNLGAWSKIARAAGASLHSDCVQTFGKIPIPPEVDVATVSAHKLGGPKGIGAIGVRAGVKVKPLVAGGGQEREVRGGTENVAAIAGFGAIPFDARSPEFEFSLPGAVFTTMGPRLAGITHVRFPGIQSESLLIRLDREGIAASAGAACSSGSLEASHVLLAAGYSETEARQGVRFSTGWNTTAKDVAEASTRITRVVESIQSGRGH